MGSLSNLYISQSYQSLIHLATNNTASATLIDLQDGLGNSIGVSVNTGGDLYLSGSLTASLQQGYLYVGGANGKTYSFPTSSLVTNINTGSLVTTASFNQYTSSTNNRLNNLESTSASVNISISNLNSTTASQAISISNLNTYTQSNDEKWNTLGGQSGSWITESETGSFARYDVSNPWSANQTFTNITAVSASFTYVQTTYETSSVIYSSGSNIFGDELTDTQTLSGSVKVQGSLTVNGTNVLTSSIPLTSLNSFTASQNTKNTTLENVTASLQQFTASNGNTSLNLYTQSNDAKWNTLGGQTGSYVTSAITASSLVTASVSLNTITFTKGDTSTFNITVDTGSGGATTDITSLNQFTASQYISNSFFATTGSNAFDGNQEITGSFKVTYVGNTGNPTIEANSSQVRIFNPSPAPLEISNLSGDIYITAGGNSPFKDLQLTAGLLQPSSSTYQSQNLLQTTKIYGSLTASLQEGYTWVGDSTNTSVLVATSSFGGGGTTDISSLNAFTASQETKNTTLESVTSSLNSATASLFTSASNGLVTASISGQLLSFTKGNNSQFTLNIPTGSGTYVTGSYGSFQDSTTQSGSANTAYKFNFNQTDVSDGVILSGSTGLKVGAYGVYNLEWSGQAVQGASSAIVSVWVNVNGIQVSGSRGDVTLASNTKLLPAWNYFLTLNANDVVELQWASDSANTTWQALPTGTTPVTPAAASIIATLARVDVGGGSNSVSTTIFNSYTASTNIWTASIDQKFATIGGQSGSWGGGGTSFNYPNLQSNSGSLVLTANTFTSGSANLLHLSASAQNQANLVFKNNDNTGDTIISGSNNIFVNPTAAAAGFKRYIGGNGTIAPGPTHLPQISASMAFPVTMNNNFLNSSTPITMRGPASSSAWTISNNNFVGTVGIGQSGANNAEKVVSGLTMTNNNVAGTLSLIANQNNLTSSVTFNGNYIAGAATLIASQSAVTFTNNILADLGFTLNNNFYSGSLGLGAVSTNRNLIIGAQNSITATGFSDAGILAGNYPTFNNNIIGGTFNLLHVNATSGSTNNTVTNTIIYGNNLTITGSSNTGTTTGNAFFGRFNAVDGRRERTAGTIFAVGTGTNATTGRKTGFLIDSGSNTFVEGTFNVSGSSTFTGSVNVTGSLLVNGISAVVPVGTVSSSAQIVAYRIFATTGSNSFNGGQTITGSLNISGSLTSVDNSGNTTNTIIGLNALGMGFGGVQPSAVGNTISVAIGPGAMRFASGSNQNVAIGNNALLITSGSKNFAMGSEALSSNTTGASNIAIGTSALTRNVTGESNVAIGDSAGFSATGSFNTFIGASAGYRVTGSFNTLMGTYQGVSGEVINNNIILSDGQQQVKAQYSGSAWSFQDGIKLNQGSNKPTDIVSVNGTTTVNNSLVTSNSIILVTTQNSGTGPVYPAVVSSKGTGTFDISHGFGGSLNVAYLIINSG